MCSSVPGIAIFALVCLLSGIRSRSLYMSWDHPIYRIQPVLGIFSLGCERSMLGAGTIHQFASASCQSRGQSVGPTRSHLGGNPGVWPEAPRGISGWPSPDPLGPPLAWGDLGPPLHGSSIIMMFLQRSHTLLRALRRLRRHEAVTPRNCRRGKGFLPRGCLCREGKGPPRAALSGPEPARPD